MARISLNRFEMFGTALVWVLLWTLWQFMPGLTLGNFAALAAIVLISCVLPRYTPFGCRGATVVISMACLLLGAGVIINAWYFTYASGGTPGAPVLVNPDSSRWWSAALYACGDVRGQMPPPGYGLYGYVLGAVLWTFGATVGTALLWSMSLILGTLLTLGLLTMKLTQSRKIAVMSMVCCMCVCYWLSMGTLILKDAFIILAMSCGGYALLCRGGRLLALIAVAAAMLALARPGCILFLAAGVCMLQLRRNSLPASLTAIALCIVVWSIPQILEINTKIELTVAADEGLCYEFDSPQQMAYYNIVGKYTALPLLHKILLLPMSAVVQFFIPFPWNFGRDIVFGLTQAYAHVAYPWYVFGGILIYYLATGLRRFRKPLFLITFWALLCWLAPCYIFGGTVSRYGLPMVALFAPAVAVTLHDRWQLRGFRVYMLVFAVLVGCTLAVAHHLQTSAMQ